MLNLIIKFPELQGYAHAVKCFDKQLLNQLKERDNQIKEIPKDVIKNGAFRDRITKIESEGLLRNQFQFEFIDIKESYEKAKILFYKEISLGVKDGIISVIGNFKQKSYN